MFIMIVYLVSFKMHPHREYDRHKPVYMPRFNCAQIQTVTTQSDHVLNYAFCAGTYIDH